jgi:putative transposase
VKSNKYECLNNFIFFGERHLRYVIQEFMAHYPAERFHQSIGGRLIKAQAGSANGNGTGATIVCRSRLGGMLNFYHREAA